MPKEAGLLGVLVAISLGASLGAILRWWISSVGNPEGYLPWGTLSVNIIGGFAIGLVLVVLSHHPDWSPLWRLFLVTGLLGGLTTFSSFSHETMSLWLEGELWRAFWHTFLNVVGSLLATFCGIWVAHRLFPL